MRREGVSLFKMQRKKPGVWGLEFWLLFIFTRKFFTFRHLFAILILIIQSGGIKVEKTENTPQEVINEIPAEGAAPKKRSKLRTFLKYLGRVALVLLETVLLVAFALYGVMYVLAKGPSPTARDLFVMSVRETSAMGFLANLYFTDEQIAQIEAKEPVDEYLETDSSLVEIPDANQPTGDDESGPVADQWGLVDEDGDGIIVQTVKGEGYTGLMMVILDPSRVIMGAVPESFGSQSYTVSNMAERFGAVAAINAGGFVDPDGEGDGSTPDAMVVYEGKIYYQHKGIRSGFVGLDSQHILHVGQFTVEDIREREIQYGVGFGPLLVVNGEIPTISTTGVNPRTAIGQRSDGAILFLVIDGRQLSSLGCTCRDLAEIFLSYGAVNACNLDGGSSTLMWYQDRYINNCASVIGIRPVPTTFLVLEKGAQDNG